MDHAAARIVRLEGAIDEAVRQAPPEIRAVIEALQSLRGVARTTAATIVSELGSLSRFERPQQLMGYSGLVPREYSSGNRVRREEITKTGNGHLRRVLVEAAWAYRHRPNVSGSILHRQKNLDLDDEVKKMAWKAQQRLHKRYTALAARQEQEPDRGGGETGVTRIHPGDCDAHRTAAEASYSSGLSEILFT